MNQTVAIDNENFEDEVIKSTIPVLVDFWASWCGPCRMVAPVLEGIASEYSGRVKICKVNVEENEALAVKHNIVSIPCFVVYDKGSIITQKAGAGSKHDIESLFKNLL